jgi:bleomycin hydrolase
MSKTIFTVTLMCFVLSAFAGMPYAQQPKDKGVFIEDKNEFYEQLEKEVDQFKSKPKKAERSFKLDFSGYDLPKSKDEFTFYWHSEPVSQGMAGTCWCFSTTSFLESEIYRLYKKEVKLSQGYTFYWEYVEKARRFVQERGNSSFGEGSEFNAVTRMWKKYGTVPLAAYTTLKPKQKFHDHRAMFEEMEGFLNSLKLSKAWNEEAALATIKAILNHYLGEPPSKIVWENQEMTPQEFLRNVIKIVPDDYIDILSLLEKPYYEKVEYPVPDNWWYSSDYYNVPLDEYMNLLKKVVRAGYTVAIGGDVSEPGYDSHAKVAIVPSFDIPSQYIDESARQFRFDNKTTTDDHGVHLVGYKEKDGVMWFLIQDSASGSRNVKPAGYYFYHEDYVKLKMMNFMVHRSAVAETLQKFVKK